MMQTSDIMSECCRRQAQEQQLEERENQFVISEATMVGAERRLNAAALSKAEIRLQTASLVRDHEH